MRSTSAQHRPRLRRPRPIVVAVALMSVVGMASVLAQDPKRPVRPPDYGQFERLGPRTPLSPDGRWLAVPIMRVDGTSELRTYSVSNVGSPVVAEEGRDPVFAENSAWLAYRVGQPEAEREQLREEGEPVQDGLGLLRLESGEADTVDGVGSFDFGAGGGYIVIHRYLPSSEEESGADRRGADLVVRDLAGGGEFTIGNVAEYAWQPEGSLLAVVIETRDGVGNGVQLYDVASGSLRVLASATDPGASFSGFAWRDEASDLAFLRSIDRDGLDGPTHAVVAWRDLDGAADMLVYDPTVADGFPADMRVSPHDAPSWSENGATLFFAIQEWYEDPGSGGKEDSSAGFDRGSSGRLEGAVEDSAADGEDDAVEESGEQVESSSVEIWHSGDEQVIPMQRVRRERNRQAGYLAAWHLDEGAFVRLGTDLDETLALLEGQRLATETDRQAYRFHNMFDRDWNDLWLIDVASGDRRKVIEDVGYFYGDSATGRYLLYYKGNHFWSYDIESDEHRNLTLGLPVSFVDHDYDTPVRVQQPPWGVGGWLVGDQAVLLYDEYDVWAVAPDGADAEKLTEGAGELVRHRVADVDGDIDAEERGLDPEHIWLQLYGERSKKYGLARTSAGAPDRTAPYAGTDRLVWLDKNVGQLAKALEAETYSYVVQGFDDSPDVFVGAADLGAAQQVTSTNPFQSDYAWGRSELIEYQSACGRELQGALFYPAEYDPSKTYPMLVYVYERLSQTVHSYSVPSERSPYNPAVFTAEGYFVLHPDIVYRNRRPGTSAVECIVPAVQAAIATRMIDVENVGLVGHSWGGYEASFVPTQTDVFAASIAGAPLTNFFSMFGTVHWNPGLPETDHFETGQARMEVPYWDDLEAYVRESPIMHITDLETPMMIFFGDEDGVVDWHQGVEIYNYARRAGKFLVMLVYPGEDHSARQKNNQVDYHHRVLSWFGHFLKGEEAPDWITSGKPLLERQREIEAQKVRRQESSR